MDKWLKCDYCGCGVHADTVDGKIENHQCKDRQIAQLEEQVESLKDLHLTISDLKERLEKEYDRGYEDGEEAGHRLGMRAGREIYGEE